MSSTSAHLPKPQPSDEHQHVWHFCDTKPLVVKKVKISVYSCYCGTFLRRDQRC